MTKNEKKNTEIRPNQVLPESLALINHQMFGIWKCEHKVYYSLMIDEKAILLVIGYFVHWKILRSMRYTRI